MVRPASKPVLLREVQPFVPESARIPPNQVAPSKKIVLKKKYECDPAYPVIRRIQLRTCLSLGVGLRLMLARGREGRGTNKVCEARLIAMFLAKEMTGKSLPYLGRCFGMRHHTTILAAIKSLRAKMDCRPELAERVQILRAELSQ